MYLNVRRSKPYAFFMQEYHTTPAGSVNCFLLSAPRAVFARVWLCFVFFLYGDDEFYDYFREF